MVLHHVIVVQLLSHVRLFAILWTAAHQTSLSFAISWSLLKHAQTHVHQDGGANQPFYPLLPPSPPAFNLSQLQGLF